MDKFPKYKGIYYEYVPKTAANKNWCDVWMLYDNKETGYLATYNADIYRIDQCFEEYFKEYGK